MSRFYSQPGIPRADHYRPHLQDTAQPSLTTDQQLTLPSALDFPPVPGAPVCTPGIVRLPLLKQGQLH